MQINLYFWWEKIVLHSLNISLPGSCVLLIPGPSPNRCPYWFVCISDWRIHRPISLYQVHQFRSKLTPLLGKHWCLDLETSSDGEFLRRRTRHRPGNEQLLQQPTVPADSSAYTLTYSLRWHFTLLHVAHEREWQYLPKIQNQVILTFLPVSWLVLAWPLPARSPPAAPASWWCILAAASPPILMQQLSSFFPVLGTWQNNGEKKKLDPPCSPFPDGFGTSGCCRKKKIIWKAYFDEEKRNTR